jgi:hypothetical protein
LDPVKLAPPGGRLLAVIDDEDIEIPGMVSLRRSTFNRHPVSALLDKVRLSALFRKSLSMARHTKKLGGLAVEIMKEALPCRLHWNCPKTSCRNFDPSGRTCHG